MTSIETSHFVLSVTVNILRFVEESVPNAGPHLIDFCFLLISLKCNGNLQDSWIETCNLARRDVRTDPDHKPKTRPRWPISASWASLPVCTFFNQSLIVWMCWLTDVIGIVKGVEDLRTLKSKQGRDLKKRDIFLVDETKVQIRLTLWANDVRFARWIWWRVIKLLGQIINLKDSVNFSQIWHLKDFKLHSWRSGFENFYQIKL